MADKQKQNVPALRFPEFDGEWEKKYLGDGIALVSGQHLSPNEYTKEHGDCPYFTGPSDFTNEPNKLTKWTTVNSKKASAGDVLVTVKGSGVGELWYLKLPTVAMGRQLMAIHGEGYRSDLVFHFLSTRRNYLTALAAGNMIPGLSRTDLLKIKVKFPPSPEQKKIAAFLSAVDRKIGQLSRKKQGLEHTKKGMMQKLFSRELRFKDDSGHDFPDWQEKRLGDVAKIYDGTHQTPKYVKTGVPFYSVEHVTANQFKTTKFISEEVFEKECKRVAIEKGDILMTRIGSIGVAKYIDWDVHASFYVSLALIKSSPKLISKFLAQYIMDEAFQRELWKRTIHVAFPIKINLGEIGNCLVRIPHPDEQQKIASFLSALDRKIELVALELDHAKNFKKGLLQQMFV